jgi:3-hydroxyacyl-[acyl-carrier-protein] dehydratase
MRWIWIDKFVQFERGKSATAVKNVSLAEDHIHDLYPDFPLMPQTLIIEGMAQTAGILVGHARDFSEKVILAKIGRASFRELSRPGDTLAYHARIEQLNETGASISGTVRNGLAADAPVVAEIEMMFSHIDKNMAGLAFPEHNFVFTDQFMQLLKTYKNGAAIAI